MANNVLEFYLQMKDMMSSGLVKVSSTARNTFSGIQKNVKSAQDNVKFMSHSIDELKLKLESVNRVKFGTVLKSEFKAAKAEARQLENQINRLQGRSVRQSFGGGLLGKAASFIAPIAIAGTLMSFGKSSVKSAMEFAAQKTSFGVLTASKSTGDALANDLRKLQQDTILGLSVYKNAQTMLGFGISADKILPDLKMLGDVSMGDADKLKHLTLAFSEVNAAGNLNGKRMLQFVNAGFNPLLEMSRTTGKSVEELTHMMHKGRITTAMLEGAFKSATSTGGRFNNMLNTIAETTQGKLERMGGQWASLKIKAGEALIPIAAGLMDWATGLLEVINSTEKTSTILRQQRTEIGGLVGVITSLNQGNETRKMLLQELINKYPEFFQGINAETVKNQELLNVLLKVNGAYDKRVAKAGNRELHEEYQKEIKSASSRMESFAVLLNLMKQGKYDEALILKRKILPGMPDYSITGDDKIRTIKMLERNLSHSTSTYNKYKNLDNGVMANDNSAFLNDELFPFIRQQKSKATILDSKKKLFDFNAEVQAMFKAVGWHNGSANTAKLAGYDFTKLRSMMQGKVSAKDIPGSPADETTLKDNKSMAGNIAAGGPRTINIHGVKFMDKFEFHGTTITESKKELETIFQDMFLRILNSGASVQ